MPIIQFFADRPELSALFALTIIGFTISYGAAFALGRIGVEIGFVLGFSPFVRRVLGVMVGGLIGLLIGGGAGAAVGSRYELGPPHVLIGMISFLGLTMGTFLGGIQRDPLVPVDLDLHQREMPHDSVARERIRWLVWHYTALELGQAISLAIAIVVGTLWGAGIETIFDHLASAGMGARVLHAVLGGVAGAILGGCGALFANPQGKTLTVTVGMILGLCSACAIGALIITLGRQTSDYLIPGLVYGSLGGFCFGLLGGDPLHAKPVD